MKCLKILVAIGAITVLCSNLSWAGTIDVVSVNEDRNALIDITLCGVEAAIDDLKTWTDDDRFYILFSAKEVGKDGCNPLPQEKIPVPACSDYIKIVTLLYSEITPEPKGDTYKDLSIDSLDVELRVDREACCDEKFEACVTVCDEEDQECKDPCKAQYDICMMDDFEITVDCDPDTLNLKSNGNYLTCYLSSTYKEGVGDINQETLYLLYTDDSGTTHLPSLFSTIEEDQLMVKFSRLDLIEAIDETNVPFEIELFVGGEQYIGDDFEATDTIRVIKPPHFKTGLLGQTVHLSGPDIDSSVVKSGIIFWGDRERTIVSASELSKGVSHTYKYKTKHGYKIRVQIKDKSGFETNYSYDKNDNLEINFD